MSVVFELQQKLVHVLEVRELDHDLELLKLDVQWVLVVAEEDSYFFVEHVRPLLDDQVDVADGDVLDLGVSAHERDQRRSQLSADASDLVEALDEVHVLQDDLGGGEDNGAVGVRQIRNDSLDRLVDIFEFCRSVLGQEVEDVDAAPLRALGDGVQELVENVLRHHDRVLSRGLDLGEGSDCIGDDHAVSIRNHHEQLWNEIFGTLWRQLMKFGNAEGRSLANVRILVVHRLLQRLDEVVEHGLDSNAAQGPDRHATDQRVDFLSAIFPEGINSKNSQIWLSLRVVDDVEIHQLFQVEVVGLDALQHREEQLADILADGHGGDDLSDGIHLLLYLVGGQLLLELVDLTPLAFEAD